MANALARRGRPPLLVHTGQHAGLDLAACGFAPPQALRLHCPGRADPNRHVAAVNKALAARLPSGIRLLIVQGDTSSALGAALAGFMLGVPVAHVEAGLRTHDPAMPWPEEEYRTAIDAHAELLFAPTERNAENLRREGVPGTIHVTGNPGIDALLRAVESLPALRLRETGRPRLLVTCHRRENWGPPMQALADALAELAGDGVEILVTLHPNAHVSSDLRRLVGSRRGISLIPPASHAGLVGLMRECDLLLSDSGGLQEEAPALGVPLLVLRQKTERPEALATGNARLVGTEPGQIVGAVRRLLADPVARAAMARPAYPFGDGRAAPRIATIVEQWLEEKGIERRSA